MSPNSRGITCSSINRVIHHGMMSTFLRDHAFKGTPSRSTVGLVSDRTKRVRIHTPGFPTVARPVEDNVFFLEDHIPAPPEWIELVNGQR